MFNIARRFGISLAALLAVNPEISDPDLIYPGQVVRIPLMPPTRPPVGRLLYVVQPGDTLFSIAQRFSLDLNLLIQANPQIADPDLIFPGQIVFVPARPAAPVRVPPPAEVVGERPSVEVSVEVETREMPPAAPEVMPDLMPEVDFCPPPVDFEPLPRPQERPVSEDDRHYHRHHRRHHDHHRR